MSKVMTASVIFVQLAPSEDVSAFVGYGGKDDGALKHRIELSVAPPQDVTDDRDWMRQVLAALTEAI